jgi:hypothetical protein
MSYVGFEPTFPASERVKTVHVLDRSATVTGPVTFNFRNSGASVRQRTTPTERPPLVGEISAKFSG